MRYSEFKSEKEFKKFCRDNKITLEEYFNKYEPRQDLLTGEVIPYKNRYNYFSIDFVNKKNMATWLKAIRAEEAEKYILNALKKRANKKEWKFFPSQVECRSTKEIPALNILDYAKNDKILDGLGLEKRFVYPNSIKYQFANLENLILGFDTREQKILKFRNVKMVESKLNFGDYAPLNEPYFNNVFFERKSIQDLWGTMSQGFDRFCREVERAASQEGYIIVVVDYLFYKAQSYNHNKRFSRASSDFIFNRIKDLLQEYSNIQFVFSGGRKESVELIKKIILMGENAKIYDIQYLMDMKML